MRSILGDIDGIDFVNLTSKDVVRHELVQKIVDAYRDFDDRIER
jgi:phosphate starvation-inducible PhoH-like protein